MSDLWPTRIPGGVAPGGIVFDVWIDGRRCRRTPIPAADVERASEIGYDDVAWALAAAGGVGEAIALVVYDGDSGAMLGGMSGAVAYVIVTGRAGLG